MKKILIITHPLGLNYGGIAQAFALQKISSGKDTEATTTHATPNRRTLSYLKQSVVDSIRSRKLHIYTRRNEALQKTYYGREA